MLNAIISFPDERVHVREPRYPLRGGMHGIPEARGVPGAMERKFSDFSAALCRLSASLSARRYRQETEFFRSCWT